MVPAAPTAAAVATTANTPITFTAVAVRQRLDVQAVHAKALEPAPRVLWGPHGLQK